MFNIVDVDTTYKDWLLHDMGNKNTKQLYI